MLEAFNGGEASRTASIQVGKTVRGLLSPAIQVEMLDQLFQLFNNPLRDDQPQGNEILTQLLLARFTDSHGQEMPLNPNLRLCLVFGPQRQLVISLRKLFPNSECIQAPECYDVPGIVDQLVDRYPQVVVHTDTSQYLFRAGRLLTLRPGTLDPQDIQVIYAQPKVRSYAPHVLGFSKEGRLQYPGGAVWAPEFARALATQIRPDYTPYSFLETTDQILTKTDTGNEDYAFFRYFRGSHYPEVISKHAEIFGLNRSQSSNLPGVGNPIGG